MNRNLTTVEMFSGIGVFRYGLEKSGWRTVWANDNDKYACKIYRKHFGDNELIEEDIKNIDAHSIPEHKLLTGGFPCQGLSFAGKRKGFEDSRTALFWDIARVAEAKRPELLLLENVKGLLSNGEGETFAIILQTLDDLGYDVEWQVLNSKYFGVPQNRERIFIIGHLRGTGSRQIFPIGQACEKSDHPCRKTSKKRKLLQLANTLSSRYYKDGSENLILLSHTKANIQQRMQNRRETWTLDGTSQKQAVMVDFNPDGNVYVKRHSHALRSPKAIRRLTPIECERLQGLPDNWTSEISDTQRYRLLGNAVTANVVEFLGEKLKLC